MHIIVQYIPYIHIWYCDYEYYCILFFIFTYDIVIMRLIVYYSLYSHMILSICVLLYIISYIHIWYCKYAYYCILFLIFTYVIVIMRIIVYYSLYSHNKDTVIIRIIVGFGRCKTCSQIMTINSNIFLPNSFFEKLLFLKTLFFRGGSMCDIKLFTYV